MEYSQDNLLLPRNTRQCLAQSQGLTVGSRIMHFYFMNCHHQVLILSISQNPIRTFSPPKDKPPTLFPFSSFHLTKKSLKSALKTRKNSTRMFLSLKAQLSGQYRIKYDQNQFLAFLLSKKCSSLLRNYSIKGLLWLITTLKNDAFLPEQNSPGVTLIFSSINSILAKSIVFLIVGRLSSQISMSIVAQKAPGECPTLQYGKWLRASSSISWFYLSNCMFCSILSSLPLFYRICGMLVCMTVFGIKMMLSIPRMCLLYFSWLTADEQIIIQPILHPGLKYRFSNPELFIIVISPASYGFTSSAKIGAFSPQVNSSQIQSTTKRIPFFLQIFMIYDFSY